MMFSSGSVVGLLSASLYLTSVSAFQPAGRLPVCRPVNTQLAGYLDDLSTYLKSPEEANPDPDSETHEATKLDKEKVDRFGVGDWNSFVDFDEFDGGDGQMGVAGDGKKGLEKDWKKQAEVIKSRSISAKVAWGKTTGYAEELIEKGVEASRAQQLENWQNQQEVLKARNQAKWLTNDFDQSKYDADWRKLSTYEAQRTQDFDLDSAFGPVVPGGTQLGTIELSGRTSAWQTFEFSIKNPFMGFSDFRAAFTPETNQAEWTVTPSEGSLNGRAAPTDFVVKFRPNKPGISEGYLVIQTEEDKWTWKLIGKGSM